MTKIKFDTLYVKFVSFLLIFKILKFQILELWSQLTTQIIM